ncbi:MAG: response regulator [Candidatus Omnitrophica bacterium]|nr:response regulator [Candidatus Omnitrophota bacterium]
MDKNIFSFLKPKRASKNIRILVIEDTEVDQRLICAAVERGGYVSFKANDGQSGLKMAKEVKPDLIILDYNLPDIKGPELCKLLKAHNETENIPVLYLTGMTAPDQVINCYEQGENYLAKPISVKLLLKQIDVILKDRPYAGS